MYAMRRACVCVGEGVRAGCAPWLPCLLLPKPSTFTCALRRCSTAEHNEAAPTRGAAPETEPGNGDVAPPSATAPSDDAEAAVKNKADAATISAARATGTIFGRYRDIDRAACAQEEGAVPLPAGLSPSVVGGGSGQGCADCAHAARGEGAQSPPSSAATATSPEEPFLTLPEQERRAAQEMQRFLAQNALRSIQNTLSAGSKALQEGGTGAAPAAEAGSLSAVATDAVGSYANPTRRRGVKALLDYNKQWAAEVTHFNPRYFHELAKVQKPEYLWIGCSDSRVPANEIVGLHPGDVFVHRNIGNIFSLSDLNCLSALQFAVDCLQVQHVIVAGHYKCGGVTAAMRGDKLGLTDHWIMQVTDIKNKWWERVMAEVPVAYHLNVLCELNVLEQLSHLVHCKILQRRWQQQNASGNHDAPYSSHFYVRPQYALEHHLQVPGAVRTVQETSTQLWRQDELDVHGWVYSLDDGVLRPLISLNRFSNTKKCIADALEAVFVRYSLMR